MYHIVYKITNLIDSKYYIGMHSTNDLDDGYMGSGDVIKNAVRKHGADKFKREILAFLESRDLAFEMEAKIITKEVAADPLCYNLRTGGRSGTRVNKKKELFSIEATTLQISQDVRFHPEFQYIFKPDLKGLKSWNDHTDHLIETYKNSKNEKVRDFIKLQEMLRPHTDEFWLILMGHITKWYNRKSTHKKALKILKTIRGKNLLDCLYAEEVRWENSDKTAK